MEQKDSKMGIDVENITSEEREPGTNERNARNMLQTNVTKETVNCPAHGKAAALDINMEASLAKEDVEKAGGFGATDDIRSFLPGALDFTDFEASLRDAREYEEDCGPVSRPGLGWCNSAAMANKEK